MDEDKIFFVGQVVEITGSYGNGKWAGVKAMVEPWPEDEEQFVNGLLQNWLSPFFNRPDGFGTSEFMWPARDLKKVG